MINSNKKYGFTLMELMVAVIIIAVLAAVAVPQYKKAVLKSRFSTLMPLAQSVAKGNEVYYLANGEYADRKDKLDVEGPGTNPEGTQVNVVDSEDYNYVIASRNSLPNKYIVYQAHSPKFAGNIHCEAEDKNTPAMELCKSLGGQEIGGSQTDGYVTYVLEGTYGEDDTLPTSLTKLKEQLCANIDPEDCIVDEKNKTITTKECTGTLLSGKTCINQTYNETGTPINYEKQETNCTSGHYYAPAVCDITYSDEHGTVKRTEQDVCATQYNTARWNANTGECTPNTGGSAASPYKEHYDYGNSYATAQRCTKFENEKCSEYFLQWWDDPTKTSDATVNSRSVKCASSEPNNDLTCNSGDWRSVFEQKVNEHGIIISRVELRPINDNDTTFYNTGTGGTITGSQIYWNELSKDGLSIVNQTVPTRRGENITFTTRNQQTNEVVNTETCAATNADWQTGTCKPGTAI